MFFNEIQSPEKQLQLYLSSYEEMSKWCGEKFELKLKKYERLYIIYYRLFYYLTIK